MGASPLRMMFHPSRGVPLEPHRNEETTNRLNTYLICILHKNEYSCLLFNFFYYFLKTLEKRPFALLLLALRLVSCSATLIMVFRQTLRPRQCQGLSLHSDYLILCCLKERNLAVPILCPTTLVHPCGQFDYS